MHINVVAGMMPSCHKVLHAEKMYFMHCSKSEAVMAFCLWLSRWTRSEKPKVSIF